MGSKEEEKFPLKGEDHIYDDNVKADDLNLWKGKIVMDGYETPVLIRKGGREIKKSCYDTMKTFQHNSCMPHLGFYMVPGGMGRLVVPIVKKSFDKWVQSDGAKKLFEENGNMSVLFRTMMIDVCDIVTKLNKKNIMIKNLNVSNLYLAAEDSTRILLLVTEVEEKKASSNIELLTPVKKIVEWCYDECKVEQNYATTRYCDFLLKQEFSMESLRTYPHNWDYNTKGEYLISLMASKIDVSQAFHKTGVHWPRVNGVLPEVLDEIIKHHNALPTTTNYNATVRVDYLILLRDSFKHFSKFPYHLKKLIGSQEKFISMVDSWSPNIWVDLYDTYGCQ